METLLRDIRFAFKLLIKDRGFTITAVLTLAVCIGSNTAIFTILNSVLLRPLPVPEADRILLMSNQYPNAGVGRSNNSGVPDYYDRLRSVNVFEEQAMVTSMGLTVDVNGTPERLQGMSGTPSLFRLLRVTPVVGRLFTEEEGQVEQAQKVILSYGLWQQLYGSDSAVVGRELRLSGRPYTVVGVMPKDLLFMDPDVRFWTVLAFSDQEKSDERRHSNNYFNVGRLKAGTTLEQAQSQVDAINLANLDKFPHFKEILINVGFHTTVEPLQDMLVRDVRGILYLLAGGAAFVLLIGALNIANVVMARSNMRMRELVTRLALGAARGRVTRQLVTESIILALVGGITGLALGTGILQALGIIGLQEIPRASEIHMDATAIAFTIGIALVVGVLIGVMPLGQLFNSDLNSMLREEGRSGTSGRAVKAIRRTLVVAQVGFAFVLLIGAGLLLASFRQLLTVDPGFKSEGVMTWSIGTPSAKYPERAQVLGFVARSLEAIRSIPGVTAAGVTTTIPFSGNYSDSVIVAEGYQMQPGESLISPRQVRITPGYFEAMSIQLVRGRFFDDRDAPTAPRTVIVDERLARKFWPNQDPIGRRMFLPDDPRDLLKITEQTRWLTVVGVVKDVRLEDLAGGANSVGAYYFPFAQNWSRSKVFAVKTAGDTAAVMQAVRREMSRIDPELPLFDVRTMEERTATSLMSRKASMLIALAFGMIALFLSAVGIYGVLAYLVAQRTKEIGIRIALGSTASEIFRLVLREGLLLVIVGFILGIAGTVVLRRSIENQIYGVQPLDPLVMGAVVVALGAVALVACTLPARRATRVDPVIVLNQ